MVRGMNMKTSTILVRTPRRNRIRRGSPIVSALFYIIIAILCFAAAYPIYYVIIKSISDPVRAVKENITFLPAGFYLGLYKPIVMDIMMWRSYAFTIFYTAANTLLVLLTSIMGAYPLASPKLRGRKLVVFYMLIPMFFYGGMIPSFLNNLQLGLYNNVWAMIIPGGVNIGYIILLRTYFFSSVPAELRESAEMDGAGVLKILTKIYVPLAKPVLAVIAIYCIVGNWNSWFGAMIYLPNPDLHPLQMYLRRVLVAQTVDLTQNVTRDMLDEAVRQSLSAQQMKYALIVFTTLPILMIYPFFQKHFVKGIMLGSLKG